MGRIVQPSAPGDGRDGIVKREDLHRLFSPCVLMAQLLVTGTDSLTSTPCPMWWRWHSLIRASMVHLCRSRLLEELRYGFRRNGQSRCSVGEDRKSRIVRSLAVPYVCTWWGWISWAGTWVSGGGGGDVFYTRTCVHVYVCL